MSHETLRGFLRARGVEAELRVFDASCHRVADAARAVGGAPPFGFDAAVLVAARVLERAWGWAGGGSDRALVRVAPREMLRANGGRAARVRA